MWRGRWQLGQFAGLGVQCTDASGDAAAPDDAPTMTIYDSSFTEVQSRLIPPKDPNNITGQFEYENLLDSDFSVGRYTVRYEYVVGVTHNGAAIDAFEVIPGGHVKGAIDSLYSYELPHATFLITRGEAGVLESRKNPKV